MLTIRDPTSVGAMAIGVSYDAFVDDVEVRAHVARRTLKSLCNPQPRQSYIERRASACRKALYCPNNFSMRHSPVIPGSHSLALR